tara:strand:- start:496 stop:726 length:231 start_codon:yes stop_codon:yes gene_type:complete
MKGAINIQPRNDSYGGVIYLYDSVEKAIDALPEVVEMYDDGDITPADIEEMEGSNSWDTETYTYVVNHVMDKRSKS